MIKKLVVLLFLAHCAFSKKEVPEDILTIWRSVAGAYEDECMKSCNLTEQQIGTMMTDAFVPNEPEFHKYWTCIYRKIGVIRSDGEFDRKLIMDTFSYMSKKITNGCTGTATMEKTLDDKSYAMAECTLDALANVIDN